MNIDELYIFVSCDEAGEGICSARLHEMVVPLVAPDVNRLQSLIPIAREAARNSNTKVKLLKFTVREEVMELDA
jgi:hypothetical protein